MSLATTSSAAGTATSSAASTDCAMPSSPEDEAVVRWLESMAGHPDVAVRRIVARAEQTPAEVLAKLADDPEPAIRNLVAGRPAASPDEPQELSASVGEIVPDLPVVSSADASESALNTLSVHPDPLVRVGVAGNPATPPEILSKLATDAESDVRLAVGGHPATPARALLRLLADPDHRVVASAAQNPSVPVGWISGRLLAHRHPLVRSTLASRCTEQADVLTYLAADEVASVREAVASNRATPPHVLAFLARDEEMGVREAVAKNECAPVEALESLARDPKASVLIHVATHASTTPEILDLLSERGGHLVCLELARNPLTPVDALRRLAERRRNTHIHRKWGHLSNAQLDRGRGSPDVRRALAARHALPLELMQLLAQAREPAVMEALAHNPTCDMVLLGSIVASKPKYARTAVAALHHDCTGHEGGTCLLPARVLNELLHLPEDVLATWVARAYRGEKRSLSMRTWVRAVLARPDLPIGHIAVALKSGASKRDVTRVAGMPDSPAAIRRVIGEPSAPFAHRVRAAATLKESVIERFVGHPDRAVRLGIAMNRDAGEFVASLVDDSDPEVRELARRRVSMALMGATQAGGHQ